MTYLLQQLLIHLQFSSILEMSTLYPSILLLHLFSKVKVQAQRREKEDLASQLREEQRKARSEHIRKEREEKALRVCYSVILCFQVIILRYSYALYTAYSFLLGWYCCVILFEFKPQGR